MEELGEEDICVGPVNSIKETMADPQVRHRRMVIDVDTPAGPSATIGMPIKLSDTPAALRTPPAGFGEHTDSVLAELGLSSSEIEGMRARGIV
jgi:crotonobetainyl-CoA:carnitine CoA-transferase CaiB-like acyl-CoA transferase